MDIEKSVEHLKAYDPEVGEAIGLELMRVSAAISN